jgi:hypothetical protein
MYPTTRWNGLLKVSRSPINQNGLGLAVVDDNVVLFGDDDDEESESESEEDDDDDDDERDCGKNSDEPIK